MSRFAAAAAFAIVLCTSPAAAQFGGSPEEQVDGDFAPLASTYGVDDGKWDADHDAYLDEPDGKQDWVGEDASAEDWLDESDADGAAPSDFYPDKDYRAEEHAEVGDVETWQGSDGRNYCRRSDGTTGLVLGAGAGALVGRGFDTRGERGTGTILGAIAGALLGSAVERGASCR